MMRVAEYNRPGSFRGDTLLGLTISITLGGVDADISSARLQLRTSSGKLVYDWVPVVVGNLVTFDEIPPEITKDFPVGVLEFDLKVTLSSGRVVTWLKGTQPILVDRTR